ncbi:reverse transcriptase domain-containing protein [Geomonas edaphica]|uniref:reverse transcriptase domain-containing protein n=1 Tax=Geomonas edaphica TaxID=2570226 RepID=UPI0013A5C892|nr:reverse transcriptase domain-containing protein [Geomonas edaphica]
MISPYVKSFIKRDFKRSLFPLSSVPKFVDKGLGKMGKYISTNIFGKSGTFQTANSFLSSKDKTTFRRVQVLDPFASVFFYDFMYRNWKAFPLTKNNERQSYGYAFKNGCLVTAFDGYHDFRRRKYSLKAKYTYYAKIDVRDCFNSFNHEDLARFIFSVVKHEDGKAFEKFLHDINVGNPHCTFPQGIYPAKALGNGYLSFIEKSKRLKSPAIIRFLDDIFLFSNKMSTLEDDLTIIEEMLDQRGLVLNVTKTEYGDDFSDFEDRHIDDIKKALLARREEEVDYDDDDEDDDEDVDDEDDGDDSDEDGYDRDFEGLTAEELEYLEALIQSKDVAEEDVELALSLLKYDEEKAFELISMVIDSYPNLLKNVYTYLEDTDYIGDFSRCIGKRLISNKVTEHELFWLSKIVIDCYEMNKHTADILNKAYHAPAATDIVRALILEAEDEEGHLMPLKESALNNIEESLAASSLIVGLKNLHRTDRRAAYKKISDIGPGYKTLCSLMLIDDADSSSPFEF